MKIIPSTLYISRDNIPPVVSVFKVFREDKDGILRTMFALNSPPLPIDTEILYKSLDNVLVEQDTYSPLYPVGFHGFFHSEEAVAYKKLWEKKLNLQDDRLIVYAILLRGIYATGKVVIKDGEVKTGGVYIGDRMTIWCPLKLQS